MIHFPLVCLVVLNAARCTSRSRVKAIGLYSFFWALLILYFVTTHLEVEASGNRSRQQTCFRNNDVDILFGLRSHHIDFYSTQVGIYNGNKNPTTQTSSLNYLKLSKREDITNTKAVIWLSTIHQPYQKYFPLDTNTKNVIRIVEDVVFSPIFPTPFKSRARLAAVSDSALVDCLDLDLTLTLSPLFLSLISGNYESELGHILPKPLTHRYGGHQFGYWAGQLGDGRAHLIGSRINRQKERWEMQLKGSGLTPYSRRGDGRAVLRSSVREFLASEAMYHLGIPTSRAATLVVSDDTFARDQFYDGNVIYERGAVVMRLAPSWFRFGSLEILTKNGEFELLRTLVDFVIDQHFPQIESTNEDKYLILFREIVMATAHMIALWQSVGFTHGVCNTDNFSLLSITIDYGPFGFMDTFDPKFVPNTSDDEARYSYENQPKVGFYNLDKLKQALWPLWDLSQRQSAEIILQGYHDQFREKYLNTFLRKLGLRNVIDKDSDEKLIKMFLRIMSETGSDFTLTFRHLGDRSLEILRTKEFSKDSWTMRLIGKHFLYADFLHLYINRLEEEGTSDGQRQTLMSSKNPRYILRNWMTERAINLAEKNDFSGIKLLQEILKNPFIIHKEAEKNKFADKPPYWASHIRISCSS